MTANSSRRKRRSRRVYSDELKGEAVQMLLDGRRAEAVAKNLGLSSVSLWYRWKAKLLRQDGAAAAAAIGDPRAAAAISPQVAIVMPSADRSPRVLIARLSAIGDVVLSMPLACALRDRFPGAPIGWVVERPAARRSADGRDGAGRH